MKNFKHRLKEASVYFLEKQVLFTIMIMVIAILLTAFLVLGDAVGRNYRSIGPTKRYTTENSLVKIRLFSNSYKTTQEEKDYIFNFFKENEDVILGSFYDFAPDGQKFIINYGKSKEFYKDTSDTIVYRDRNLRNTIEGAAWSRDYFYQIDANTTNTYINQYKGLVVYKTIDEVIEILQPLPLKDIINSFIFVNADKEIIDEFLFMTNFFSSDNITDDYVVIAENINDRMYDNVFGNNWSILKSEIAIVTIASILGVFLISALVYFTALEDIRKNNIDITNKIERHKVYDRIILLNIILVFIAVVISVVSLVIVYPQVNIIYTLLLLIFDTCLLCIYPVIKIKNRAKALIKKQNLKFSI
ncbi:MAG: hypothetical protein ACK5KQ_01755 [Anaerorhabdus sp.]